MRCSDHFGHFKTRMAMSKAQMLGVGYGKRRILVFILMLALSKVFMLVQKWLNKDTTCSITISTGLSSKTVCSWIRHFRNLAADNAEEGYVIGGEDVVVEIDVSKISKRKFNRGHHHVEGAWHGCLAALKKQARKNVFRWRYQMEQHPPS